jgi:hypothetical protein
LMPTMESGPSHSRADPRRPPRVPYDSKQGISLTEQGIALSLTRKHVSHLAILAIETSRSRSAE